MNDQTYIRILEKILKESDNLEEFSGVAAVGGFTGPLGAPVPKVGKPILKASKKKKKRKLSEADSNFKYMPKLDADKIKINQKNWRYEKEKDLIQNFESLLNSAHIEISNKQQTISAIQNLFNNSKEKNVSEIKSMIKQEMNELQFTTNVFSKLHEKLLQELVVVNKTTKEKLKNGKEDISEDDIKSAISKAYGQSAVDLFSKISLKEKPVSIIQYTKNKISNAYSYTINAFKILLSTIGIKTMFEEGGITGILKKIVKQYLGVDIDAISKEIDEIKNKMSNTYESAKQKFRNTLDYLSGNEDIKNSKEAIENISDESKQDLAQSSWDTFLVWDKYIIYILTAFAVINIISIYFIWRNSKTNIREALNNFLNDQISHASLDNELANILAKDAAIVVLNKYFEDKGKPLIESKFKYYKKPLSYYLL